MLRWSFPALAVWLCACASEPPAAPPPTAAASARPAPAAAPRDRPAPASAQRDLVGVQVHLTIDDLPWQIERGTPMPLAPPEVLSWNMRLLAALQARQVKASVFFVCERMQIGANTVEMWNNHGHAVGNHTHTHASLAELGPDAWLADTSQCHDVLFGRLKEPPVWFRYPYLGYGDGPDAQLAAREGLGALGYRNAPVTVATTEWMHAYAYRRAVGEPEKRAEIVADWHQHMDDALAEGRRLAQRTQGREVPQVVLVHMNELVAEHLRDLIDRWTARGVTFVDLPTAMEDAVFALEPQYTGAGGLSWLARVAAPEEREPYWFGEEEKRVVERFGPPPVKGVE